MAIKRLLSAWLKAAAGRLPSPSQFAWGNSDRGLLSRRLQANPQLRFESLGELQAAAALGIRIDVSQAGQEDWLRLPGLSIHQARSLTQLTQSGVQFYELADLAAALGLPLSQVQGYGPILQFYFYGRDERPALINPNLASPQALRQLPGMGAELAEAIAQARDSQGPFRNLADLQQRLNLSPATLEQLMHYLRF